MAELVFEARTLDGLNRAFLEPRGISYVRRLNAASSVRFAHDQNAKQRELLAVERAIAMWRDGEIRLNGPIVPPSPQRKPRTVSIDAQDAWWFLSWRQTQPADLYGTTPLGSIVSGLLATQNARATTHLRMGDVAVAPAADRDYSDGTQFVASAIVDTLCQIDHGIWVRVDAVDEDEIMGALQVLYPDAGVLQPEAKFEFGDGTIGNLADYDVQYTDVKNSVTALGASFGAGQETAVATDAASQARFGIFDDTVQFTDESDTTSLQQHANEELQPEPKTILSITPLAGDAAAANDVFVPMLWDDFDVGDVLPVYIRDDDFELDVLGRVTEVPVTVVDASGREQLGTMTLEVVE